MIVLDTNVLSESLRVTPTESVIRWLDTQPKAVLFTTTICEAEMLYGLALLPAGRRRLALERAITAIFEEDFPDRVLPFDEAAARSYAVIAAARRALGNPIQALDAQIAAIARSRGAAIATRNVQHFVNCEIIVIDPWQEQKS